MSINPVLLVVTNVQRVCALPQHDLDDEMQQVPVISERREGGCERTQSTCLTPGSLEPCAHPLNGDTQEGDARVCAAERNDLSWDSSARVSVLTWETNHVLERPIFGKL